MWLKRHCHESKQKLTQDLTSPEGFRNSQLGRLEATENSVRISAILYLSWALSSLAGLNHITLNCYLLRWIYADTRLFFIPNFTVQSQVKKIVIENSPYLLSLEHFACFYHSCESIGLSLIYDCATVWTYI